MDFLSGIIDYFSGWWTTLSKWWGYLEGWWETLSNWIDDYFSGFNAMLADLGIADWFNDFILSWGDWIVGWARVIAIGAISYLTGSFLWRLMTYFLGVAVVEQAKFITKTGLATYLIIWFWHVTFKSLGVSILTFAAWGTELIPKVETAVISGINHIPPVFKPMIIYFDIPDAIHFIFSVFMVIATFKAATWVFKPPSPLT